MRIRLGLLALTLGLFTVLACSCGSADATIWSVPTDAATVNTAIDSAANGDTICIENGTYTNFGTGWGIYVDKSITLTAEQPDSVVLDAQGIDNRRIIHIHTSNVTVENITFYRAKKLGSEGGAVRAEGGSTLSGIIINNCIFKNNNSIYGGAVYIEDAGIHIMNSRFYNRNRATYGGGIYISGSTNFDVTINNNIFWKCRAIAGGAAIHVAASNPPNVTITRNTFDHNKSESGIPRATVILASSEDIFKYNIIAWPESSYALGWNLGDCEDLADSTNQSCNNFWECDADSVGALGIVTEDCEEYYDPNSTWNLVEKPGFQCRLQQYYITERDCMLDVDCLPQGMEFILGAINDTWTDGFPNDCGHLEACTGQP